MPKWVKNTLWLLVMLILLARWREVGHWLAEAAGNLGEMFGRSCFGFYSRPFRLAVFGILVVALVAMWGMYWRNRGDA